MIAICECMGKPQICWNILGRVSRRAAGGYVCTKTLLRIVFLQPSDHAVSLHEAISYLISTDTHTCSSNKALLQLPHPQTSPCFSWGASQLILHHFISLLPWDGCYFFRLHFYSLFFHCKKKKTMCFLDKSPPKNEGFPTNFLAAVYQFRLIIAKEKLLFSEKICAFTTFLFPLCYFFTTQMLSKITYSVSSHSILQTLRYITYKRYWNELHKSNSTGEICTLPVACWEASTEQKKKKNRKSLSLVKMWSSQPQTPSAFAKWSETDLSTAELTWKSDLIASWTLKTRQFIIVNMNSIFRYHLRGGAKPESNKDGVWRSALGSSFMRGEGCQRTQNTSCVLLPQTRWRKTRKESQEDEGVRSLARLVSASLCPVCVSPIS